MDIDKVFSYTKVKGIAIGDVTNIFYDRHNDIVVITEDKGNSFGTVKHTFGTKANGLIELIDTLYAYHQKMYTERETMFAEIRKAISGNS